MLKLLMLFAITFFTMFTFCWLLILCRRRTLRLRHSVTGSCHDSGATTCCSCSSTSLENLRSPKLPMHQP